MQNIELAVTNRYGESIKTKVKNDNLIKYILDNCGLSFSYPSGAEVPYCFVSITNPIKFDWVGCSVRVASRVSLHILVASHYHGEIPKGMVVDHIDRDSMNNTPENLRIVTQAINNVNKGISKRNKTGFIGVQRKPSGRWEAAVVNGGIRIYLGLYDSDIEAARMVNRAYENLYPDVAIPNPAAEIDSEFYFGGDDLILTSL